MSPGNIFKTKPKIHTRITSSSMYKDRSSPFSRPYSKPEEKEEKPEKNDLYDIDAIEDAVYRNTKTILEKLVLFILVLIGKKQEWQEAKSKLTTMQNRINQFETIINKSKDQTVLSANIKNYRI